MSLQILGTCLYDHLAGEVSDLHAGRQRPPAFVQLLPFRVGDASAPSHVCNCISASCMSAERHSKISMRGLSGIHSFSTVVQDFVFLSRVWSSGLCILRNLQAFRKRGGFVRCWFTSFLTWSGFSEYVHANRNTCTQIGRCFPAELNSDYKRNPDTSKCHSERRVKLTFEGALLYMYTYGQYVYICQIFIHMYNMHT